MGLSFIFKGSLKIWITFHADSETIPHSCFWNWDWHGFQTAAYHVLLLPLIVSVNTAHKCVCCHSQLRKYWYSCENIKYYKLGSVRTAQHSKSYTASDVYGICTCTKPEKVPHGEGLQCWPGPNRASILSALTRVEHGLTGRCAKPSNASSGNIPPHPSCFLSQCIGCHIYIWLHSRNKLQPQSFTPWPSGAGL